jgi:hypothetical protein
MPRKHRGTRIALVDIILRTSLRSSLAVAASVVVVGIGSTGCLGHAVDRSGPTTCAPDAFEANDTQETARDLGSLQDDPDSSRHISATVHAGSDVDWYRVHVSDTGIGGNPNVTVSVPQGFSVTTWFVCDQGYVNDKTCLQGSPETMTVNDVEGCRGSVPEPTTDASGTTVYPTDEVAASTTDCSGTSDDNGTLFVRVERTSSQASTCSYDLSIAVE